MARTPAIDSEDPLTSAGLALLRALVGVADESLVETGTDVTLPQFRVLLAIGTEGPIPSSTLARLLGVAPSTATRMCDRLVRDKLLARGTSPDDRRLVTVSLTARGNRVVSKVIDWRRAELSRRFASIDSFRRRDLADALDVCTAALHSSAMTPAER
jgi:DNA-binding MarR family transcriptional regulator